MGGRAQHLPPSAFVKLHAALPFFKISVRRLLLLLFLLLLLLRLLLLLVVVVVNVNVNVVARLEGGWGGRRGASPPVHS